MKPLENLRAMPLLGIMFHCDKGEDCDRCHGTGLVCQAHPYTPRGGLTKNGCTCGAPGLACADARRIPIVVTIRVRGWPHRVLCTESTRA